jgi:HSP20 family protein
MALFSFSDPVQGLLSLQHELDRFFHKPQGYDLGPSGVGVFPPINVFGDGDGIVVRAEVPGVEPSAIDVQIENRTLTISGERREPARNKGSYHRRERRYGKFSRSLQLPDRLDSEQATAECRHGLLTVRIPQRAEAKPRQVKVEA